jgi:hypothetical protein
MLADAASVDEITQEKRLRFWSLRVCEELLGLADIHDATGDHQCDT